MTKPQWKHDCDKCRFLGQTIGGGKMHDLYIHGDTLIARYSDNGPDYFSTLRGYARPEGHAELFACEAMAKHITDS